MTIAVNMFCLLLLFCYILCENKLKLLIVDYVQFFFRDQCPLPNVCCKKLNTNPLIPANTVQVGTRTTLEDVSPPMFNPPEVINDERLITYMYLVDNCRLIDFQCRCTSVFSCKPENNVQYLVENAFHAT